MVSIRVVDAANNIISVNSLPALGSANSANSLPITFATDGVLPLPTGAASNTGLTTIVTALGNPLQANGTIQVGNFPTTQAVSGTVSTPNNSASGVTPLIGTQSTGTTTVGPLNPVLYRNINLLLTGTWTGSVQLMSSNDGGNTKIPLTLSGSTWGIYTSNCNEPVWENTESGITYYLVLNITSGTLTYRISQ